LKRREKNFLGIFEVTQLEKIGSIKLEPLEITSTVPTAILLSKNPLPAYKPSPEERTKLKILSSSTEARKPNLPPEMSPLPWTKTLT